MAKRVFFSFHYEDVSSFRANVVRQSWVTKPDRESAGFFDASIWEEAQKKGDAALKTMIEEGLTGTSVTAVLIGSETYSRRWVKYEIFSSIKRGNKVLGLHINQIRCNQRLTKAHGPNPFEYLGLYYQDDGKKVSPCELHNDGKWYFNDDIEGWVLKTPQPQKNEKIFKLSENRSCYCWVTHDGYNNFSNWID